MAGPLLNADEIFDSAAKVHGLDKYADAGMRERFAQIIDSLNQNGTIADGARPAALAQLAGLVRRRLELARDWSLYPEIDNERIEHPFFVLGSGRTGTSAMQSMLALGDGCRTPLLWECGHPSPPPGLDPESEPGRIALENAQMNSFINTAPGFLLSHPYVDAGAFMETEDEDLFGIDFRATHPFHFNRIPTLSLASLRLACGLADALRFHKKLLKHLQWKRPAQHWVCKGTQHHYAVPALWEVYPDALCVWTHRDPVTFMASVLGIIQHFYTPITGKPVRGEVAQGFLDGVRAGYDAIFSGNWLEDERLVHVRFDAFVRDPVSVIGQIYERAGLALSPAYEQRLGKWLADPGNKSDRHGKFIYSLEQFGLNSADVRRKFADYYDRFLT